MTKKTFKGLLIIFAILLIATVAFFYPEHVESVARALMLVIGVI